MNTQHRSAGSLGPVSTGFRKHVAGKSCRGLLSWLCLFSLLPQLLSADITGVLEMLYIVNAGMSYWFSFTANNKAAAASQIQLVRICKTRNILRVSTSFGCDEQYVGDCWFLLGWNQSYAVIVRQFNSAHFECGSVETDRHTVFPCKEDYFKLAGSQLLLLANSSSHCSMTTWG